MKAKTRILAMLLTVLMVAGLLPLTLFAVAGDTPSEPVNAGATSNTWEQINQTLKANGLDGYVYQSFENVPASKFNSDGIFDFPGGATDGHRGEWWAIDDNSRIDTAIDFVSRVGYNPFEMKNQKDAYSIRIESNGNKALYLGNATYADTQNDDNFFDIETDAIASSSDILVSVDFKMGGKFVAHA